MYSIITGAGSGLGLELAKALAKKNKPLILLGRNSEKLAHAESIIKEINPELDIQCCAVDISHEIEVKAFIASLEKNLFLVSNLYNVAGSSYYGAMRDITQKDIETVLNANFIGLMLMTLRVSDYMLTHPVDNQRIVSVLSTAALKGKRFETIYNASKWGARGFLESVRDELSDTAIEVINIFPGGMKTPFWDNSPSGYAIDSFMAPEDVAEEIAALSSNQNIFISDITISRPKPKPTK